MSIMLLLLLLLWREVRVSEDYSHANTPKMAFIFMMITFVQHPYLITLLRINIRCMCKSHHGSSGSPITRINVTKVSF